MRRTATNWSDSSSPGPGHSLRRIPAGFVSGESLPFVYLMNHDVQIVSKSPVFQQAVQVNLANGLHLRPQSQIVRLAQQFDCDVNIRIDDRTVDAKSMFDLMTLKAAQGTTLYLEASGANADEAIRQLAELFESNFEGEESSSS